MTNIPFTTAASDFLKYVEYRDDSKSDLIDYAATDFLSLRDALISYIKAVYPLDYNLFSESDLGMMLVEMVAYMGSVMSMKADMLAHECFLKTAKNPVNVRKLLQLVGVKFRGPSSAVAQAYLNIDDGTVLSEGESIEIPVSERVFSTTSEVDNAGITYVLYMVKNGKILDVDGSNNITLTYEDSDGQNGQTWSNLVLIEGTLVVDSNIFADVDVIKSVGLQSSPVIDGSVEVFIDAPDPANSEVYTEVQSLLSTSSSNQAAFEISYNPDYSAKVLFGDGVTGKLPQVGSTYTINYRTGGGVRGNAATGFINEQKTGSKGASEVTFNVTNTTPFTGGQDAETLEHVRKYAQLTFRQQDRLVSLDDYISFANTFKSPTGSSGKAIAVTRDAFSSANIIDIYLVEKASDLQLQKASIAFKTSMLEAMEPKKMMTDDIVLVDGLIRTLDLVIEVSVDTKYQNSEGAIKTAIARVVTNYFNVDNKEFGESFFPEDISREIFQSIPQVRLARVMNYEKPVTLEFNEIIQLNNFSINFNYV